MLHHTLPAFVSVVLGLVALAPLAAQEPAPARKDTAYVLPGISVTSARHGAIPSRVPFALSRIERSGWQGLRSFGLDEALSRVPGVLAQSRYGTSDIRLVIRGFGARGAGDRSNAGTTRGIRVLLDGFPETEPDGRTAFDNIDLAAASGIEVIRSNVSSLYGNAAGGVVNVSTLRDFDSAFGEAQLETGSYGLFRLVASAGAPVGSGRASGTIVRTDFDGWRAHSNAERTLANVVVAGDLDERTELGVYLVGSSNQFRIPGPLTQAQVDADPSQANAIYNSRDERRFNRVGRLGARLEHEMGGAGRITASSYIMPKFLQRSERGTFRDFTRYHVGGNAVYSNAGNLGPRLRGNVMAGVDEAYQDGAILFYSLTPQGTRGTEIRDNRREGANNLGVFAQAGLEPGERWAVTLGARYDRVTYYTQSFINPALDASKVFDRVTPKAAVNFLVGPGHSFYANLGGGVEVPAGNETDPASTFGQPDPVTGLNPLLDAITSTTFEVGTKRALAPSAGAFESLSYDAAVYHTRVKNDIVPYRGGRFYLTAGKTNRTGVEASLTARTRSGVSLTGAFTWAKNTYAEYVVDSIHYDLPPGHLADYSGNEMIGVPKVMYNVALAWAPPRLSGFRVQLGIQGSGKYFADDANALSVPGYTLLSGTVALDQPVTLAGGLGVRGYLTVNNLANRKFIGSAFLNPDIVGGVPVAFEPGMPRAVIVGVTLGWQ